MMEYYESIMRAKGAVEMGAMRKIGDSADSKEAEAIGLKEAMSWVKILNITHYIGEWHVTPLDFIQHVLFAWTIGSPNSDRRNSRYRRNKKNQEIPEGQGGRATIGSGRAHLTENKGGRAAEDPNMHIRDFIEICDTFKFNNVFKDVVKLRLFPFSMRNKAKSWLHSLPAGSITTWEDLAQKFLTKFFPMAKTAAIRNALTQFA
ncbi:hypothetical protein AgCh_027791 [Apium graveolens]